jgi:signal peptidase I
MDHDHYYDKDNKKFRKTEVEPEDSPDKSNDGGIGEIIRFAVLAIAIVLPIRIFIAQPFIVSGTSMVPTFDSGEYIIVDQVSYRLSEPKRGDVVIFKFPEDQSKFFIKRVIGLPGETISIKGNDVFITNSKNPSGFKLDEPYIMNYGPSDVSYHLSEDEVFVMGDNRQSSYDSRFWGPLPESMIVGKAFLRLLPVNAIDLLPGSYNL